MTDRGSPQLPSWAEDSLIFLVVWVVLVFGGRSRLFRDPGTFWHTVVGQQILASGHLPHTDSFSFTFAGKPWAATQWLGEVLMALLNRLGGWDALLLATAGALAILYAWLFKRLRQAGFSFLLACLVAALAFLGVSYHSHVRPNILSFLFFALLYAGLLDVEAGRRQLKKLWWLVPVFWLWVNSHGAALGGLATLALCLAGWTLAWAGGKATPVKSWRDLAGMSALFLACSCMVFLTPYGLETPRTWLALMGSPVLPQVIQEHRPLFQLSPAEIGLALVFPLAYIAALLGTFPGWPRITWLIPLVWFGLGLMRVRHEPFFTLSAALALTDLLPRCRWAARLADRGSEVLRFSPPRGPGRRFSWAPLALTLAGLAIVAGLNLGDGPRDRLARFDPTYWPVELLPALHSAEGSLPEGAPIFNDMLFGGFLIFHAPRFKVFIDDRCELYGDAFIEAFVKAPAAEVENWADRYGFKLALTQAGSRYNQYLKNSPRWQELGRGRAGSLYRRRP